MDFHQQRIYIIIYIIYIHDTKQKQQFTPNTITSQQLHPISQFNGQISFQINQCLQTQIIQITIHATVRKRINTST